MALSLEEREGFARDGYTVARRLVPASAIHALLGECERIIEHQAQALARGGSITELHAELDVHHRAAALFEQDPAIIAPLRGGRHAGPALFALLTHPAIVDAIEQLIGPEIWCLGLYRLRPKVRSPEQIGALPWHQDANAYQPAADRRAIVTAWIALADATPEMGVLEMLAGSQRARRLHRHYWVKRLGLTAIHPDDFPAGERKVMPVSAGDVILFTSFTAHSSLPNTTDKVRWSLDCRYHAPTADEIWPDEPGFLARSVERDAEVLRSAERFAELRRRATFNASKQQRPWRTEDQESFVRPRW